MILLAYALGGLAAAVLVVLAAIVIDQQRRLAWLRDRCILLEQQAEYAKRTAGQYEAFVRWYRRAWGPISIPAGPSTPRGADGRSQEVAR